MLIYHFTDLESALNIVHSKTFRAHSSDIYNGDSGLNSFPTLKGNFNYGQNFTKEGVILVFDWSGNIDKNASIYKYTHTMDRNTMYIQGSWRSFIPVNADSKYLKAIKIIYDANVINELIEYPFYYHFIPNFFRNFKSKIYEKCKLEVDNQFIELFKDKNIHISVI